MSKPNKTISVLLVFVLLLSFFGINTYAASEEELFREIDSQVVKDWYDQQPQTRSAMSIMELALGKEGNQLRVYYITLSAWNCSEIGIKNLTLQKRVWWGWQDIRVTNPVSYNSDSNIGGYFYLQPSAGDTYRLIGEHYCVIDGIRYSQLHTSATFSF